MFSVNENNKIYPLRLNQKDCQKSIDLFLFEQDEKSNYFLIKNFSRLTRSQITSDTNSKIHICKRCFLHFTKQELFKKHITYCSNNETVSAKMPPKNTKLQFQNYHKKRPIPFVVYADFECFTMKPLSTCQPYPHDSYTISKIFVEKIEAKKIKLIMIIARNQNHLNLHHKKKRNLIKQKYVISVRKNFMMMIQLQKR